jgi:hypothetical protein
MTIIFDPTNKIVQLDSTSVSAATIWSRWVDFVALSDNAKYGEVMTQLGGVAPVDLYIFMENGWRVRPLEADGITTITGNLLVTGGGSPIAQTLGNFNVLVNMETPVKASAIVVNGGGGSSSPTVSEIVTGLTPNLTTINNNVKKASLLIPASEDLI